MPYDYDRTHELILEHAGEQFLERGFRGASIRQICRQAGVTNGAFYAHFQSKEDLFRHLVEPALNGLSEQYGAETERYRTIRSPEDILACFEQALSSDERLIRYIYDHKDAFRLLLLASDGTGYEGFPAQLTAREERETAAFFEQCRPYVRRPENLSENLMGTISAMVVRTMFDCLLAGKTAEETIRETQLASEFCLAGLRQIWGI